MTTARIRRHSGAAFDWHADAAAKLTRLGLYADRRVAAAASAAYGAAWSRGQNRKYGDPDDSVAVAISAATA
jgi:hypothetical protein